MQGSGTMLRAGKGHVRLEKQIWVSFHQPYRPTKISSERICEMWSVAFYSRAAVPHPHFATELEPMTSEEDHDLT